MALGFQISAGTIPGRSHIGYGNLLKGSNNQDSFEVQLYEDCIIALVLDGCGSGRHSEIGAKIGGVLLSRAMLELARSGALSMVATKDSISEQLEQTKKRCLKQLRKIISSMEVGICRHDFNEYCNCDFKNFIQDYLLFTTVGVIVTLHKTVVFSLGDGIYAVNGELREIGPYPGNAPPYLAYSLFGNSRFEDDFLKIKLHKVIPTEDLETVMIATDGLRDLLDKERRAIPGKNRPVGHISQIWNDDNFFTEENPDSLTPWLRQLNSEVTRFNSLEMQLERHQGLLPDDTTVIALRRR